MFSGSIRPPIISGVWFSATVTGAGLLLWSALLYSQVAAAPQGPSDQVKNDLVQIERKIGRANLDCDYKYFDLIEAKEFIFTSASGEVTTKTEDLAGEKDCHKSSASYDLDQTDVQLYGSAAIVTSRVTISGKNKEGNSFTHRSRFTDVFVWRDGRWQMVAGHSSGIPEARR